MTSLTPFDTHHEVVINRTKFDVCTNSSFRGVKTDTQTDKQHALYILDTQKNLLPPKKNFWM